MLAWPLESLPNYKQPNISGQNKTYFWTNLQASCKNYIISYPNYFYKCNKELNLSPQDSDEIILILKNNLPHLRKNKKNVEWL